MLRNIINDVFVPFHDLHSLWKRKTKLHSGKIDERHSRDVVIDEELKEERNVRFIRLKLSSHHCSTSHHVHNLCHHLRIVALKTNQKMKHIREEKEDKKDKKSLHENFEEYFFVEMKSIERFATNHRNIVNVLSFGSKCNVHRSLYTCSQLLHI
jgi:hypothetical protein